MRIEVFGKTGCGRLEPDSAAGVAAKYIPPSQVIAPSASDSSHKASEGTLFSQRSWNSKPFYTCPDKISDGSHQPVPQSMCAPNAGADEWWKLLGSPIEIWLYKDLPMERMINLQERKAAATLRTKPQKICINKSCISFKIEDAASRVTEMERERAA